MKKIYISSSQILVNDFLTIQLKSELAEFGYEIMETILGRILNTLLIKQILLLGF